MALHGADGDLYSVRVSGSLKPAAVNFVTQPFMARAMARAFTRCR